MRDSSCSTVEVVDNALLHAGFCEKGTCGLIENFCSAAVGLEEGKGSHLKGKPQQTFREIVLPIENLCAIVLDDICHCVVDSVQDAYNLPIHM